MDCSPPGSSVHGIFQVRILEWVAISFSKAYRYFLLFHMICICKTQGRSIKIPILDPQPLLPEVIPALHSWRTSFQPFSRAFAYARTQARARAHTHTHTHTHTHSKMPGCQMHSETHIHPDTQGHADTRELLQHVERLLRILSGVGVFRQTHL